MWKEAVVTKFEVLQHLPGGTDDNHDKSESCDHGADCSVVTWRELLKDGFVTGTVYWSSRGVKELREYFEH
jgi:hypothetical protein